MPSLLGLHQRNPSNDTVDDGSATKTNLSKNGFGNGISSDHRNKFGSNKNDNDCDDVENNVMAHLVLSHHQQHPNKTTEAEHKTATTSTAIGTAVDNDDDIDTTNKKTTTNLLQMSPAAWKAFMSCLLYSFCSISMILTNKSLASR